MKILIFGSTGFIGKNITAALLNESYDVIAPNRHDCNLLEIKSVQRIVKVHQPDIIINTAFTGVNSNIHYSHDYVFDNLTIITNILQSSKEAKQLKKLIHFGSGLEYGNSKKAISEKKQLEPLNTYASVKAISTLLTLDLARTFKLPLIVLRPFNVYGEYDNKSVIYYIIKSIVNKTAFSITRGEQIRDYLYIRDVTAIILQILNNYQRFNDGQVYNISSNHPRKLKEIFTTIFSLMKYTAKPTYKEYAEHEYMNQIGDNSKLKKIISLPELTSLQEGLKNTIEWVKTSL